MNEEERSRQGGRREEGRKEKEPMRRQGRRHQINVRLMLLSAHSAAELRILDSGASLGLDEKDFRRDFLCTSPVSHPHQPARRPLSLRFRYEDVRASSLRRLPGKIFQHES